MAKCIQCGRQLPAFSFKKICQWCQLHEAEQRGEATDKVRQRVIRAQWVSRESTISFTHVLLGANVAIFFAMVLASRSIDFPNAIAVHFGANVGLYTLTGEWWRLFTYMFLHGGIFHILINMWCLWNFGDLCESLYGRWTYAGIYLVTGLAGGLGSIIWNPGAFTVGASGALFGLTGALIASVHLGEFSFSAMSNTSILTSLIFWAAFSLFFGFVSPGIDNSCHIGGLISGLALGAVIAKFAPREEHASRRVLVFVFAAVALAACAVALAHHYGVPLRLGRSPFHQ